MAKKSGFSKAKRENVWTKTLLVGPSGSGKSYSALLVAQGIAKKCGSRMAVIDTERGRIRYYADEFDFDDMQLEDCSPENYIEAINDAVDAGYKVLVIDSTTHEWNYCVEVHDKMPGNSYTNWGKITPRHDRFMETVLQAPIHVVATARGKDEYILEEKNGKQTPKKVGKGAKLRDGSEYEYTVVLNLSMDHIADVSKDNTHLFEGKYEKLTSKDGERIYDWANSGVEAPAKPKKKTIEREEVSVNEPTEIVDEGIEISLDEIKKSIGIVVKGLQDDGVSVDDIKATCKKVLGYVNYNKVDDVEKANQLLEELKNLN